MSSFSGAAAAGDCVRAFSRPRRRPSLAPSRVAGREYGTFFSVLSHFNTLFFFFVYYFFQVDFRLRFERTQPYSFYSKDPPILGIISICITPLHQRKTRTLSRVTYRFSPRVPLCAAPLGRAVSRPGSIFGPHSRRAASRLERHCCGYPGYQPYGLGG